MSARESLCECALQKGDKIRTTRELTFQTLYGLRRLPAETPGTITSAGEVAVFAMVGGWEMEMLPGEYERA